MRVIPAQPEYLRASFTGRPVSVDRANGRLLGYVVAQEGPFKSRGRGRFDAESLSQIAAMGNAARGGLKVRFTHPGLSSDGLGKFLGRAHDFTVGTATDAAGKQVKAVRADLHFDPSAKNTPHGNLSDYVMQLAESDPDAISSSLVIDPDRFVEDGRGGLLKLADDEEPMPGVTPLWRPRKLVASDIVDTGDAVDGLLSADQWAAALRFDNPVRLAEQMLDRFFEGNDRAAVEARCSGFLADYLARRFGDDAPVATPRLDAAAARMAKLTAAAAGRK